MSVQFNQVILAGNLTRDPQVRFFANDKARADFGLAINRRWTAADGTKQEAVTFVDVMAWGKVAETIGKHCGKGAGVLVSGRLDMETWEKDGTKRSRLVVTADEVRFTTPKPETVETVNPETGEVTRTPAAGGAT